MRLKQLAQQLSIEQDKIVGNPDLPAFRVALKQYRKKYLFPVSEEHQSLVRVAKDLSVDFHADNNNKVQLFNYDDFAWNKYIIIDCLEKVTKQETAYIVLISSDLTNNKT